MNRKIAHDDVVRMLRDAAYEHGLSLERFYALGRTDALDNPSLRDLWLIWGHELSAADLQDPVPSA